MRDVSFDVQVLQEVMQEHGVCPKRLAAKANVHLNSMYMYLNGRRNLPVSMLAALFEMTRDMRIPALMFGDMPVAIDLIEDAPDFTEHYVVEGGVLESMKRFHAMQIEMVQLLIDRKVDQADAATIDAYKRARHEFIRHEAGVYRTVMAAFRSSQQKGVRQ